MLCHFGVNNTYAHSRLYPRAYKRTFKMLAELCQFSTSSGWLEILAKYFKNINVYILIGAFNISEHLNKTFVLKRKYVSVSFCQICPPNSELSVL